MVEITDNNLGDVKVIDLDAERKKEANSAPQEADPEKVPAFDKKQLSTFINGINREYALVLRGSQVLVMRYWIGEDKVSRLTFLSTKDFHTLMANQQIWNKKEEKYFALSTLWLKSKERSQYEDVYFRPCDQTYKLRYNLWRGFNVEPKQGGQHDLFLTHIFENICKGNEAHYCWIIDWLADLIQKPYRKPGTAIVLRGEMGTGKGFFAGAIGKLFGQHYIPILHPGQLTSRFNSHLADKVLIFVDESGWSQDKYGAGIIRGMITEPQMAIEMKGKDIITMENYGHFIVAANDKWVVPASMQDERRWAVFDIGLEHKDDKAYFQAIENQLTNTVMIEGKTQIINKDFPIGAGFQSLLYFLQNHKYYEINARTIPQTEALMEQKIRSMPDEFTWWHECLMYGEVGDFELRDDLTNYLPCKKFFQAYVDWCVKLRREPLSDNILPKNLGKMIELQRIQKVNLDGKREWQYLMPRLGDLRFQFNKNLGHTIEWESLETS